MDSQSGMSLLHNWHGQWYQYNEQKGYWDTLKQGELEMQLTGYLHRSNVQESGRISHNLIRDILVNLKADTLSGLPAMTYQMPCWLPNG